MVWAALVPVVGNPIIYMFCVTEYRKNIVSMWRACTGKDISYHRHTFELMRIGPKEVLEEDDEFHDIPDNQSVITSTKQTEVL